ncbi:MAG: GIY-YIG nuclease family protein, partial [Selenomonadaceae bacterium]|nr:GIY-YIG nuclease family protein [Selenomonadaceae bacterium]
MYGVIYKITNTDNGKIYIGQTTRTVEERFQEHMDSPFLIGRAIRKHGVDKFTIEVIATCETKEELDAQEIRFIAEYDCITPKGYNCKTGGEGGSHCEETKAQISQTMTGYKHTEEALANMSAAQRKRYEDPAEHEKASAAQRKRYEDPAER